MIKKGRYLEVATSIAMLLAGATSSNAATLLHQYDFTSGVTDLVGSQNGTLLGDANVSAGRLNLDGSGNYVQFATSIIPTNGSYSVTLFGQRNANQATFTEMISQGQSGGGRLLRRDKPCRQCSSWRLVGCNRCSIRSRGQFDQLCPCCGHSRRNLEVVRQWRHRRVFVHCDYHRSVWHGNAAGAPVHHYRRIFQRFPR